MPKDGRLLSIHMHGGLVIKFIPTLLLAIVLLTWFAPHLATAIDVLARPKLRWAFGGTANFLVSLCAALSALNPFRLSACAQPDLTRTGYG